MIREPENAYSFVFELPSGTKMKVFTERPVSPEVVQAITTAGVITVIAELPEVRPYGAETQL